MGKTHEALQRAEKEYQDGRVKTSPDIQKAIVLKRPSQLPIQAPSPNYEQVKARLITQFLDKSIKTILVTSTAPGDGASTTAVGLATTLAGDCRLRVLLIDVNLRSPSLHDVFNIEYGQGLWSLLMKKKSEKWSIFRKQESIRSYP